MTNKPVPEGQYATLPNGRSALHFAAQEGRAGCVLALLEAGADKDRADTDGMTALDVAVATHYESARYEETRCVLREWVGREVVVAS